MYGRSIPASEVGGDLVDALVVAGRPLSCVADVSGYGVPAGSAPNTFATAAIPCLETDSRLAYALADDLRSCTCGAPTKRSLVSRKA